MYPTKQEYGIHPLGDLSIALELIAAIPRVDPSADVETKRAHYAASVAQIEPHAPQTISYIKHAFLPHEGFNTIHSKVEMLLGMERENERRLKLYLEEYGDQIERDRNKQATREERNANKEARAARRAEREQEAAERAARREARLQRSEGKEESKAAYEARLAKYAQRKSAILNAKNALSKAIADRNLLMRQWDAYIAHLRTESRRLEGISADDWVYVADAAQSDPQP